MPKRACMTVGATNYGIAEDGTFVGDDPNTLHWEPMCEYGTGMDTDEEELGELYGGGDYTTHEEAEERGNAINTDRDRNRAEYVESQKTTEKRNATLILGGLVLYYFFGGF